MDISNVVSVTISVASPGVSRLGFGEPCVFFYGDSSTPAANPITNSERVRRYSAATVLSDMQDDGFATTDPAYLAAQAIVSQDPHPQTIKLARGGTAFTHAVEFEPTTTTEDEVCSFTMSKGGTSQTVSYTVTAGDTKNDIVTAMQASADADAAGFGTAGTGEITFAVSGGGAGDILEIDAVSPANDGEMWYYDDIENMTLEDVTADRGIATDLNTVIGVDADWYGLVLADAFGALEIDAAAGWASGQTNKILCASTQDTQVVSAGTGIGATLSSADYDETLLVYSNHSMSEYPGGAAAGRFLPETPGTEVWAMKSLSGVTPSNLSSSEVTNASDNYVNVYTGIEAGGVEIVRGNLWKGWSSGSSETFIDTIRLIDATVAEVQTRLLSLLRASSKLPYTNKGLASIKGGILNSIRKFQPLGYANGTEFCSVPDVDDVSDANKNARILPNVTFGATLAGAVLKITITAQVSY
jgi:hypothetical protein